MTYPYTKFFPAKKLMLSIVLGLIFTTVQFPSFCQSQGEKTALPIHNQTNRQSMPSAFDPNLLIVSLSANADRQKFDEALTELHGRYVQTIDAGPTLQFLVIQAEPGKSQEVEKQLAKRKDIALVERNRIYRTMIRGGSPDPNSSTPTDPGASLQWDLIVMKFMTAREMSGKLGANATRAHMCFVDTGATPTKDACRHVSQYDLSELLYPKGLKEAPHDVDIVNNHGTACASVAETTDNKLDFAGLANFEGNRCSVVM